MYKRLLELDINYSNKIYSYLNLNTRAKGVLNLFTRGYGAIPIVLIIFVIEENKVKFLLFSIFLLAFVYIAIENILKRLIRRKRPKYSDLSTFSCPSSHAFTMWAATSVLISEYFNKSELVLAFLYAFIYSIIVSLSRVVLGNHYLIDIIAGALLGISFGYIVVLTQIY